MGAELEGLITLAGGIAMLVALIATIRKAGYSGFWVLAIFVPILNIVLLLIFAFRRWPIQRELTRLRVTCDQATLADFDLLLSMAVSAEQKGDWMRAEQLFELIASKSPDEEMTAYARNSLTEIRRLHEPRDPSDNPYDPPAGA